jgi:hypothetical protein
MARRKRSGSAKATARSLSIAARPVHFNFFDPPPHLLQNS